MLLQGANRMTDEHDKEVAKAIKEFSDTVRLHIYELKVLIVEYFSEELQNDETPIGAMKRNQIRKKLLDFANQVN